MTNLIKEDIKEILYEYLAIESITNTENEKKVDKFFNNFFSDIPYFLKNPSHYGSSEIENDRLGRSVNWGFIKGSGNKTIVLMHHSDVVTIENYNNLKKYALEPEKLKEAFLNNLQVLNEEEKKDLFSDKWLFGRGVADMKGGGSIQMALLKKYSKIENFKGNIVLIAVPDEENLSAGMRYGVKILKKLKEEYNFDYKLIINSEPHERLKEDNGLISQGSIGKNNFFVYVKGVLTHCGKIYEGFNPSGLMSRIVAETELNIDFSDIANNEICPPPSWIYIKDRKKEYDISTPEGICGYINVLSYITSPLDILNKIKKICEEAFDEQLEIMESGYKFFSKITGKNNLDLAYKNKVLLFSELYEELLKTRGGLFKKEYDEYVNNLIFEYEANNIELIEVNNLLVEYLLRNFNYSGPIVVIGIAPPLYPGVSNINSTCDFDYNKTINEYTQDKWDQKYDNEYYFSGISDLSFSSLNYDIEIAKSSQNEMPLWGDFYSIPFEDIKYIEMPCINIGPWSKSFHKISERVFKEDLFERTPKIINFLISKIFNMNIEIE